MDRDKVIEMILLSDAGELEDRDREILSSALDADPELAAYAHDLGRIRELSNSASPIGPSDSTMARIREVAAENRVIPWPALRLMAAAAAVVLLLAGAGYLSWQRDTSRVQVARRPVGPEVGSQAESLYAIIVLVSQDEEGVLTEVEPGIAQGDTYLEALAAQLLQFQGLDSEPSDPAFEDDSDWLLDLG
ncbi:MAG: hypothetical protein O2923_04155 [Verrucomicrobia bacterium]|nr:hypothetical protein [Verrucomicrobiota bacterium]MDA1085647.1 hypothetical protein [Verrucomicrobiota bacterium]